MRVDCGVTVCYVVFFFFSSRRRHTSFDCDWSSDVCSSDLTIALLAAIESLLSAVVADGMIDDRHDSNQELMAQGIANIASPLFGGIPATGAIARTATNIRSGARSPVAGITHALTLVIILLSAAPLGRFIRSEKRLV